VNKYTDEEIAIAFRDAGREPDWQARAIAAEAEVVRLREALDKIANNDWVENALDPQWAANIARAALETDNG